MKAMLLYCKLEDSRWRSIMFINILLNLAQNSVRGNILVSDK